MLKSSKNPNRTRVEISNELFNLTHLSPGKELLRYRFQHRDFIAHALRYSHTCTVLQRSGKVGKATMLDVGCGPELPQLVALHSNGTAPALYVGMDARDPIIIPNVNFETAFAKHDVTLPFPDAPPQGWDFIVSYELIEHMSKESGQKFLTNIANAANSDTQILLSTPCFNGTLATNHIYEWEYMELKAELEKHFIIEDSFGTFASLTDYVPLMNEAELKVLNRLKQYYNSAMISCIMAPLFPEQSRNAVWHLKRK